MTARVVAVDEPAEEENCKESRNTNLENEGGVVGVLQGVQPKRASPMMTKNSTPQVIR